jgi:spermidine/putrescine transport system substrate-binding protein
MKTTRREILTVALGLSGCRRRRAGGEVNIYSWSDYIAADTVAGFERDTGVRVNYETFESTEEMFAKILAGGAQWDVVFPNSTYVGPMARRSLLEPLDHARLPGLANLEPRFQDPPWDRENRHSVPYMWGVSGFVYNGAKLGRDLTSWADLWEPAVRGKLTMLDDVSEVLGACLKKLGHSLNSVEPRELAAAQSEALRQKPLVRAYVNAEVKPQLIAGDVWAAQLWSGDAWQAIAENPDLRYCYPSEGPAVFSDVMVILRGARNRDAAYRWVDHLLKPEVAASISRETLFSTPNAKAVELLEPSLRANPDIYPPPERLAKAEWFAEIPAEGQELRDRLWTEIKAA